MSLSSPIDLEKLIRVLGGRLELQDQLDGNMEAMIRKFNDSFEIILDKNKPQSRRRFSIAHEIGHLFLHMGFLIDADKWEQSSDFKDSVYYRFGYSAEEKEANEFAAALLMPEKEFREIARQNETNNQVAINPIADYFDVSREAVLARGKGIGLFQW